MLDASPHDDRAPIGGLAVPVQGNNNIAQRNLAIEEADSGDADMFGGMIAGSRLGVGVASLIVDASDLRGDAAILLHVADPAIMERFEAAAIAVGRGATGGSGGAGGGGPQSGKRCGVTVETRTRLRFDCGSCEVIIEAPPGSRILSGGDGGAGHPPEISSAIHQGLAAVEVRNLRGRVEIPLRIDGGRFVPLLAAVVGDTTGDLDVTQRRGDGEISAGYGIRRV